VHFCHLLVKNFEYTSKFYDISYKVSLLYAALKHFVSFYLHYKLVYI